MKYVRNWHLVPGKEMGVRGGHEKFVQLRTGRGGVTPHLYVHNCIISFHAFGTFLFYSIFFYS